MSAPSATAARAVTGVTATLLEDGRVLRLRLGGSKGNVLSRATFSELAATLGEHGGRPDLRLVLLTADGPHFSYGASIPEHRREQAPALLAGFHRLVRQLATFPVPVAALVQGSCLGAGFELVLCCHFVFATADARFACPEIQLGVFPPVLAAVGPWRLGAPLSERLLLTGDSLEAPAAAAVGWVTGVVEGQGEAAEAAVLEWYRKTLAPLSAFALREATAAVRGDAGWAQAVDRGLAAAEARYVGRLLPSHDGNEGIAAYLEKRPPRWRER